MNPELDALYAHSQHMQNIQLLASYAQIATPIVIAVCTVLLLIALGRKKT